MNITERNAAKGADSDDNVSPVAASTTDDGTTNGAGGHASTSGSGDGTTTGGTHNGDGSVHAGNTATGGSATTTTTTTTTTGSPLPTPEPPPVLTVQNAPASFDRSVAINLSTSSIVSYRYDIFRSPSSNTCGSVASTTAVPVAAPLTVTNLGLPGPKLICIVGMAASGLESVVTAVSWQFKVPLPASAGATRFATTTPLLKAEASASDNRYVICESYPNYAGGGPGTTAGRMPSAFAYGGKIYLSIVGKNQVANDPGWVQQFAEWDGAAATATWLDSNALSPSQDSFSTRSDRVISGDRAGHFASTAYAEGPAGKLVGYDVTYYDWRAYTGYFVLSDSLMAFNSKRLRTNQPNLTSFSSPNTFMHSATSPVSLWYEGGTTYVYAESSDNAAKPHISVLKAAFDDSTIDYATLNNVNDAAAHASNGTNVFSVTAPIAAAVADYSRPYIASYSYTEGKAYYLVAYHRATSHWEAIPGVDPETFDVSAAVDLNLHGQNQIVTDWDYHLFDATGSGEPVVIGAAVLGNYLNVFYLAGEGEFPLPGPPTPPLNCARGIGVARIELVR